MRQYSRRLLIQMAGLIPVSGLAAKIETRTAPVLRVAAPQGMRTGGWHPDTCRCQFLHAWTNKADAFTRVVEARPCVHHAGLGSAQAMFEEVMRENREKNAEVCRIAAAAGIDPTTIRWRHDSQRRLVIDPPEVS